MRIALALRRQRKGFSLSAASHFHTGSISAVVMSFARADEPSSFYFCAELSMVEEARK
jgi:hypothetical protein